MATSDLLGAVHSTYVVSKEVKDKPIEPGLNKSSALEIDLEKNTGENAAQPTSLKMSQVTGKTRVVFYGETL